MTVVVHTGEYHEAAGSAPPAPLSAGPVPRGGVSPVDFAAAGFGAAANADLPGTNGDITADDTDRRGHAEDAAEKFPENEADAVSQFEGLGGQGDMAQMMPQLISGMAGGIAGALGGALSAVTQAPQQLMQAGQGALQPLMSAMQGAGDEGGDDAGWLDGMSDDELWGLGGGDSSGGGGGGEATEGGGAAGTSPAGYMGAAPVPSSSPPTTPAAAPSKPMSMAATGSTPAHVGAAGSGMMPMMPPGAMGGGGGDSNKDKKAADKRIAVPGVPNGQPVKGRMTVPPDTAVTKSAEAPKAAGPVTRRVVAPPPKDT